MEETMAQLRRTFLTKPSLQWRWAFLLGGMAVSGIFIGVALLVLLPPLLGAFSYQKVFDPVLGAGPFRISWVGLLTGSLLLFSCAVFVGLSFSHRIAGPLGRLEEILNARLRGEKTGIIRLRRQDHLQTLADRLNELFQASAQ